MPVSSEPRKISFRQKNSTKCPICSHEFYKEELHSGGGRLIAGKLTDELRRTYEPSPKYGKICPLAFILVVCPRCLYTANPKDFDAPLPDEIEKIRIQSQARIDTVKKYFGNLNFEDDRTLKHGAASYMLAVDLYGLRTKKIAPTFKRAIFAIRAAWLFNDLAQENPDAPYKKISSFFYTKAYAFYEAVLELLQNGGEPSDASSMGPDSDKNWGYEGILYLYSVLTMKIGAKETDAAKRIANLEKTKRYLSRVFGMGKTSKTKPGPLIDMTRDLYDKIKTMVDELTQGAATSQTKDA
jgi:uncharacterized protein